MPGAPLVLLTDFGSQDGYVGVMKGVILGIAPGTPLVDLTHDLPPQDVRTGAWVLHTAWRYFPADAIFLCVVDPGVGSTRRAVALRAGGRVFVGPDNGLFSYVLAAEPAERAVLLDNPRFHFPHPSATFHGRDLFAPCAAHLARGTALEDLGTPLDPADLITFALPQPEWGADGLHGHVLHVDHFGNLITGFGAALTRAILDAPPSALHIQGRVITARSTTFADGPDGEPFLLADSSGHLAVAVRNASASALLGVDVDTAVRVTGLPRAE